MIYIHFTSQAHIHQSLIALLDYGVWLLENVEAKLENMVTLSSNWIGL